MLKYTQNIFDSSIIYASLYALAFLFAKKQVTLSADTFYLFSAT